MGLRLYDTMRRTKVDFVPADPKRVTMYVCGPTVYNRAHIGNARPAVVFDVLGRLLRHQYGAGHVVYARNITDIDDKIIAAALAEGVEPKVITDRFEKYYLADMGALGVLPPDIAPHATDHVAPRVDNDGRVTGMIPMIAALVAKGAAYPAEGHVLFDVAAAGAYGALSRRNRDEMIAGARVEVAPYKKNPADFVLWKPSTPGQPGWPSPWGRGRPGWHIECSAMIEAHLGQTIDIHGGGLDLIFPHHENELAQSSCAHGAPLAGVWMHNGFLGMGSEKMSKSLGNVVTVDALLAQGWPGEVLRLALLSAHYRQPLEWTDALLQRSKATLDRWHGFLRRSPDEATALPDTVRSALSDDLNTPEAMAALAGVAKSNDIGGLRTALGLLGLLETDRRDDPRAKTVGVSLAGGGFDFTDTAAATLVISREHVEKLVVARAAARSRRDFAESDRIRDELAAAGVILEDGPDETIWRYA